MGKPQEERSPVHTPELVVMRSSQRGRVFTPTQGGVDTDLKLLSSARYKTGKSYYYEEDFKRHSQQCRNKSKFKCPDCGLSSSLLKELIEHKDVCMKKFKRRDRRRLRKANVIILKILRP